MSKGSISQFNINKSYIKANLDLNLKIDKTKSKVDNRVRAFILVLDDSFSMQGKPWEAAAKGAELVAEKLQEADKFQFNTIIFNSNARLLPSTSFIDFQTKIKKGFVGGGTAFIPVVRQIAELTQKVDDVTILFLTDGQGESTNVVMAEFDKLSNTWIQNNISSRVFSIGISSSHNADMLSKFAKAGSELGNFVQVDFKEADWVDKLTTSVEEAFALIPDSGNVKCELFNNSGQSKIIGLIKITDEGDESGVQQFKQEMVIQINDFNNLKLKISNKEEQQEVPLEIKLRSEVSHTDLLQSQVALYNQNLFTVLEELTKGAKVDKTQEKVKVIDKDLDLMIEKVFKLKPIYRKVIMAKCLECKNKVKECIEIIRQAMKSGVVSGNDLIAKLNDLAYRAVRHTGLQKKLDERAVKNKDLQDKLEKEVMDLSGKIDPDELNQKVGPIFEDLGNCMLSCMNGVELLQNQDCMCIGLEVARSEAAIADPTKLKVKRVVPLFLSAESFLASAAFNIGQDNEAHGGFGSNSKVGQLTSGLGRERVNGALPLQICEEHWAIATRKAASTFALMCTLDVMGQTTTQSLVVPFLAMSRAAQQVNEDPSAINLKMQALVSETCQATIRNRKIFRESSIEQVINFVNDPAARTIDIVPSIEVLLAITICLKDDGQLVNLEEKFQDKLAFQSAIELARRSQPHDAEPLSKEKVLELLSGTHWSEIVNDQVSQGSKINNSGVNIVEYDNVMKKFRKLAGEAIEDSDAKSAQVKDSKDSDVQAHDPEKCFDVQAKSEPYLMEDVSKIWSKQIQNIVENFTKYNSFQFSLFGLIGLKYTHLNQVNKLSNKGILLAVVIQNALHPKNSHRREAIISNTQVEINTKNNAKSQVCNLISKNMQEVYRAKLNEMMGDQKSANQTFMASKFCASNDIYQAAAQLSGMKWGSGDVPAVFKQLVHYKQEHSVSKLKMILQGEYLGEKLFTDKGNLKEWKPCKDNLRKIWLLYCFKNSDISRDTFLDLFPDKQRLQDVWQKQQNQPNK